MNVNDRTQSEDDASPSDWSLGRLVTAWKQHVQRLYSEQEKDVADPNVWGIHDYIAALYIRDRIAAVFGIHKNPDTEIDQSVLESVDRDFQSYTELDRERLLTRLEPVEYDRSSWWWSRIPKTGPARQELLSFLGVDPPSL
jgi:hypothetical protein